MDGVSIIICCYNSEKLLPKTLEHIAKQQVDNSLYWEVIIVNNNSSDRTKETASNEWNKYVHIYSPINCNFTIIDEPTPGLVYARKAGLNASRYDILIYCDDDNWLCENYVQTAYNTMIANSNIGVVGGYGEPVFENEKKPEWFDQYAKSYALGSQDPEKNRSVYGAGMVVNKKALISLYNRNFKGFLVGRQGITLSAGEDTELCLAINTIGYQILYLPDLKYKHFLPEKRLKWDYLENMRIGTANAAVVLSLYYGVIKNRNRIIFLIYMLFRSILSLFICLLKGNNDSRNLFERKKAIIMIIQNVKNFSLNYHTMKKISSLKNINK
jgi:glycosyltransferase involved in cell wall biosynthesis